MRPVLLRNAPFFAVSLTLGLLLASAACASAHARLVRSDPAKGAELVRAPAQLELWFNELLEAGFNSVQVFPVAELSQPQHASLTSGPPTVDARDHTHLTVPLRSLARGEYIVEWRVLSRDGHSAPGRLGFSVSKGK